MQEISKNELMSELELTFPKDKVEQMVELYEQFANLDTNVETGIRSLWMENVEDFYGGSGDRAMAHSYLINSESFFKKLLFVVDEEAYNQLNADNKLCLYETMKKLGLFKNVPSGLKIDSGDLSLIASEKTRAAVRAYRLRNKSAHTSERLASSRMLANVNDVISTTIDVVWKNRVIIQNKINKSMVASQVGITTLLKNIVKEYEDEAKNGFVYFPLLWQGEDRDGQNKYKRIDITELADEKHILLSADAGCGKTTSLRNLEYHLAKSYLSGNSNKIPVNIALIDESPDAKLRDIICRKLNISNTYCEELLKKGLIYLMIDGLNEFTNVAEYKKKFVISIEHFFNNFPNVQVIVTDRQFSEIPIRVEKTYHLKPMEKQDVLAYAQTKTECKKDANVLTLLEEVLNKQDSDEIIYTPLVVNQLVITLDTHKKIPDDLIGGYLEALMTREFVEKRDVNAAPGKLDMLLMYLAVAAEDVFTMSLVEAMDTCSEAIKRYCIGISSDAGINLAVQMGILRKVGEDIEFASPEYQSYYYLKAISRGAYR
ncbi:MAG: NACHT domain-containing protein [Clostridia bacterium]|nr:NACHT domain-containing protein [Clostridia bacterium]